MVSVGQWLSIQGKQFWPSSNLARQAAHSVSCSVPHHLFNKSLTQGYLPEAFRLAEITPILKKSSLDPAVLGNYRPISNLPFISKVLEQTVNERMLVHLQTNGLVPKHQSAYRRGYSTETVLLKVTSRRLARCWSRQAYTFGHVRSQRGFRLCGSRYPLESAWVIVRFLRDINRMDLALHHWQEAIRSIQWIDVNHNTHALRGASRFRARFTAFRSLRHRCFPHCWEAWFLDPRVWTICRFTIIVSSVIQFSSMVESSIVSTVWASGCWRIASNWMRRRPRLSGWVHHVVWLHARSIRSW